jgi:predicted RecB family nuclease
MSVTEEIFAAFLKCETKAYLQHSGTLGGQSEFSEWRQHQREEYRESCRKLLCSALHTSLFVGTPDIQSLKDRRYHLVLDYVITDNETNVRLDALVLSRVKRAKRDCPYIPVRFVPSEKLSRDDRLMLAFDAAALTKVYGKTPRLGRIIHGRNHTVATVALFPLLRRVQLVLRTINDQQTKGAQPILAINKHCAECEFRTRCQQSAIQKDDLSLLPTLSAKERKKQHDKGIFTVLQLALPLRFTASEEQAKRSMT